MDKTISINLGGTLFQIDEEAYRTLRNYLQSIDQRFKNVPGGNETIEDIEFRIAEIFLSKKGTAGVISKENVEEMITIIGKPEDFEHGESEGASDNYSYYNSSNTKGLYRNPENSIIGGVCGGIGAYLNTDPVWFRILFVVFAMMFGLGLFIYLALWLALPKAVTVTQKKEMYGGSPFASAHGLENHTGSRFGNALNEVFKAIGRVCYIIVRIFLIIIGTLLVLTGFLALLTFVLVFIFKYPGAFSTDAMGLNIAYIPDFLYYILTPKAVPWVKALIILVMSLPMLFIIYGGVRLIFWFRARDGYVWLAGFVIWVMSAAALSIVLFNEGLGFSDTETVTSREYLKTTPDTLYIISGRKISDLNTDKEISIPDKDYNLLFSEEKKEIYIKTRLYIIHNEEKFASVEVRKHSAGRSRSDAIRNAEKLVYNFQISGDTLFLDQFSTIPEGKKWSLDDIGVTVHVPEKTIINMDKTTESLFFDNENEINYSYEKD